MTQIIRCSCDRKYMVSPPCVYGEFLDRTFRAMTRNEKKYPSPDEFKPERFLHEDGSLTSDTMSLAFGWGRRVW
jgi:hypothetical protein